MSLNETLRRISEGAAERMGAEVMEAAGRATRELRDSGIMDGIARVGDQAPDFTGTNAAGESVALEALLGRGPVALSFYRGKW